MLATLSRIMRQISRHITPPASVLLFLALALAPSAAQACTVATEATPTSFGDQPSMAIYNGSVQTSSSATGITCITLLELLSGSYIGLKLVGPAPSLKHELLPDSIPLHISWAGSANDLAVDQLYITSDASVLGLLSTSGGRVPLQFRTQATPNIRAGKYVANIQLRWYYSVCLVGALGALCVSPTESPGVSRCTLILCGAMTSSNAGSGVPVTLRVELEVKRDCTISASGANFGSAAFPENFQAINSSINVRCTAGQTYWVSLNNGQNFNGSNRLMKRLSGTNQDPSDTGDRYMAYEIWKDALGQSRWGDTGAERLSSTDIDMNGGHTVSGTPRIVPYYATILSPQPSGLIQPAGVYKDTVRVSVDF